MAAYGNGEFYGDLLEYNMEKARKRMSNVMFYILVSVFLVLFTTLWIWPKETGSLLNQAGNSLNVDIETTKAYTWLILPGLLIIMLPFTFTMLHLLRKYWLFPKASLTQQAFLPVKAKELIIHPRSKGSNRNPRSHFIIVQHPSSSRLIPVDTAEDWFKQLKIGDQVHAYYHPVEGNILYLKKG